jgi:hypothetical protein
VTLDLFPPFCWPVWGGIFNLAAQEEVANKYLAVERCKKEISEKLEALIGQKVKI